MKVCMKMKNERLWRGSPEYASAWQAGISHSIRVYNMLPIGQALWAISYSYAQIVFNALQRLLALRFL
jgi:hypothetical protein